MTRLRQRACQPRDERAMTGVSGVVRLAGSRTRKVLPEGALRCNTSEPPCAATIVRAMGRPRPAPSAAWRDASSLTKRSKIRSRSASGMPAPPSVTAHLEGAAAAPRARRGRCPRSACGGWHCRADSSSIWRRRRSSPSNRSRRRPARSNDLDALRSRDEPRLFHGSPGRARRGRAVRAPATAGPASARASVNMSSTMPAEPSHLPLHDAAGSSRYSSSARPRAGSLTSIAVRATDTGVRSSCEASAMNRRCWREGALEPTQQLVEGIASRRARRAWRGGSRAPGGAPSIAGVERPSARAGAGRRGAIQQTAGRRPARSARAAPLTRARRSPARSASNRRQRSPPLPPGMRHIAVAVARPPEAESARLRPRRSSIAGPCRHPSPFTSADPARAASRCVPSATKMASPRPGQLEILERVVRRPRRAAAPPRAPSCIAPGRERVGARSSSLVEPRQPRAR